MDSNADFYKYHALGNDYIVIDTQKTRIDLSHDDAIRLICHRNYGVGSETAVRQKRAGTASGYSRDIWLTWDM